MNGTVEAVEASSQIDSGMGLAFIVLGVLALLYGVWVGRLTARPSSQQRSTLRKALDRHLSALESESGKDSEEYRVAAQVRHGRVLREKYD